MPMNPKGPMGTYESMKIADFGPWGYCARTLAPTSRAYGAQIGLPRIRGSKSEPCTPNLDPSNPSRTLRTTPGFRRFLWKLMDFHSFPWPAGRRAPKLEPLRSFSPLLLEMI